MCERELGKGGTDKQVRGGEGGSIMHVYLYAFVCVSDALIVTDSLSPCAQTAPATHKYSQLPYSNDGLIPSPVTVYPLTGTE